YKTRIGDTYVAEVVKSKGASFGGETSGSWIFPNLSYCPDGLHATAIMVNMVNKRALSELVDEIPTYPMKREKIECRKDMMKRVMDEVMKTIEGMDVYDVNTTDGVRAQLDRGWFLIRPSGTEPYIRITVEGNDADSLDNLLKDAKKIVKTAIKNV
ncbi:MAG: phosphoglucosamine mutase, partial [Methermicoccaceae archaeon]